MEYFSVSMAMKLWPEQYHSVDIDTGVVREKKLPGESDLDLIQRTIKKCECALAIAANEAIKRRQDITIASMNEKELEVLSQDAVRTLKLMSNNEQTMNENQDYDKKGD